MDYSAPPEPSSDTGRLTQWSLHGKQLPLPPQFCYDHQEAGIAQLVERNLAKVEVASSSLVSRSTSTWRKF